MAVRHSYIYFSFSLPVGIVKKQIWKHVRDARDFNNIETQAFMKFFFLSRQGAEGNSRHSDRNISLFPS